MKPYIFIKNSDELYVDIYTIGYHVQGESQIIIIRENTEIQYTFVIDCYETNQINKTSEILTQLGITELNYFIWTHPDLDHSLGINQIISKHCTKETVFYLPEGVYGNGDSDFIGNNPDVIKAFKTITNCSNNGTIYNVVTATTGGNTPCQILDIIFKDKSGFEIDLTISAIAPISSIVRRRMQNKSIRHKNDVSIALLFKVGSGVLFFGGDIENQTINLLPDYFFEDLYYIKTPHHTSPSSSKLIDKIEKFCVEDKIPIATSTIYKKDNLPDSSIVNDYKKLVNKFYSTGMGNDFYGYIVSTLSVKDMTYKDNKLEGNAKCLF